MYKKLVNSFGRTSHTIAHQHQGAENLIITIKVTGLEQDIVREWMDCLKKYTEDQKIMGWKDSDMCIILASKSHQDANVFLCLLLKWRASYPQIQIFFECGSISQEWPLVIVCGKKATFQKMIILSMLQMQHNYELNGIKLE